MVLHDVYMNTVFPAHRLRVRFPTVDLSRVPPLVNHFPRIVSIRSYLTMIRSNPTAIPLRSSDIKLLQAELDKRKPAPAPTTAATEAGPSDSMGKVASKEGYNAVEEGKKERQGRSVAERIGL